MNSRVMPWLRSGNERGMTWASMTVRASWRARLAMVAEPEQLSTNAGFCMNSPVPTTQSRAFLMTPVTPWAYSGLAMMTALACSR